MVFDFRSSDYFTQLGCNNDANVLDCVRQIPAKDAWEGSLTADLAKLFFLPWVPIIDDDYLSKTTYHLIEEGNYARYDALVGVNKNEGFYFLLNLPGFSRETTSELTQDQFDEGVEQAFWMLSPGVRNTAKVRKPSSSEMDNK